MEWQPEPHTVDPDIAHAVDHLNELLPSKHGVPIISARDCELAGFDLALVLEAAKGHAR